jgi:ferritin-like protein
MGFDIVKKTLIPRPPKGREEPVVQLTRLMNTHEIIIKEPREMAKRAAESGDDGSNDLLIGQVVRQNEQQVWFISAHLVEMSLVRRQDPYGSLSKLSELKPCRADRPLTMEGGRRVPRQACAISL